MYHFVYYLKILNMERNFASVFWEIDVVGAAICLNSLTADDSPRCIEALRKLLEVMKKEDVSTEVFQMEDKCLFSAEQGEVLEIIINSLETLNCGKKLPALWIYLDDEKKAVAHFCFEKKWQASLFCRSSRDVSAIHLVENIGFIPVEFKKDISEYLEEAHRAGDFYLKGYLPRDIGDFLSKKKGKPKTCSEKHIGSSHDKGDFL